MNNINITCKDIDEVFSMIQLADLRDIYIVHVIKNMMIQVFQFIFIQMTKKNLIDYLTIYQKKAVPFAIGITIDKMIITVSVNSLDSITYTKYDNIKTRLYEYIEKKREV